MNIEHFVNEVRSAYGDSLLSITLFGSSATEGLKDKYSDYNIIIVLRQVTPFELRKSCKIIRRWGKSGNPTPLFFDPHHIETSADVFPIEFFDIKENRKVLYGSDPFTHIEINDKNLRHQCEFELKGKLIQLQTRYATISKSDKETARLMVETFSTFFSIFKGILRLLKHPPEKKKRALMEKLATCIEFNPSIFMEILDIREGRAILPRKDASDKFEDYLTQIQTITNFIDKYGI